MDTTEDVIEITPKNMYVPICIAQAICVAFILIGVLVIKMFFCDAHAVLKAWCQENVLQQVETTAFEQEETSSEN